MWPLRALQGPQGTYKALKAFCGPEGPAKAPKTTTTTTTKTTAKTPDDDEAAQLECLSRRATSVGGGGRPKAVPHPCYLSLALALDFILGFGIYPCGFPPLASYA